MGRRPCCSKDEGLNRGAWTAMEDKILRDYIMVHGEGKWRNLPKRAGLKRCGKSCRLRWLNYLRPDIKRGNITRDEEDLIIRLHKLLGNRWSLIAGRLPGRTDNEIKNYWNTNIGKKVQGHPTSTSNRNKSSYRSRGNPNPRLIEQSPTIDSCVVRNKASKCTKVLISTTQPQKTHHRLDRKPVSVHDMKPEPICGHGVSVLPFISREDDPSDFLLDFEMDEKFLADFLNSTDQFAPLCDFDHNGENGDDTNTNTNDTTYSSPNSNPNVLFSDETQHDPDIGSLAFLLDPEMDWLQD